MIDRARLQMILDGEDPTYGRRVAIAIQVLIVVSVVSITISTLPNLPTWLYDFLIAEEAFIAMIFMVEYALRVYAAPDRLKYIISPFGIIDLIAFLPSLLLLGYDLRSLRFLRVFRVLTLLKLMRYVEAFNRLVNALRKVADELVVFVFTAGILLYLCATAIYLFERHAQPDVFSSIPHAMWWAVVTFTTVGYGDVVPVTAGGRIFTSIILVLALGIVAVPTGLIATALTEERREQHERDRARRKHKDDDPEPGP